MKIVKLFAQVLLGIYSLCTFITLVNMIALLFNSPLGFGPFAMIIDPKTTMLFFLSVSGQHLCLIPILLMLIIDIKTIFDIRKNRILFPAISALLCLAGLLFRLDAEYARLEPAVLLLILLIVYLVGAIRAGSKSTNMESAEEV